MMDRRQSDFENYTLSNARITCFHILENSKKGFLCETGSTSGIDLKPIAVHRYDIVSSMSHRGSFWCPYWLPLVANKPHKWFPVFWDDFLLSATTWPYQFHITTVRLSFRCLLKFILHNCFEKIPKSLYLWSANSKNFF